MVLRDRIQVNASGEQVWEVLDDPSLMELWNPKCVRCEVGRKHVHVGLRYRASFRMSGPERETDCEVIACRPCEILATRYLLDGPKLTGHVDETFRLRPRGDGTLVVHEVDFTHSDLPRWLQVFMKVMDLVGRKAGKSSLDGIKELVEKSEAESAAK